jgi:hypothetical protein
MPEFSARISGKLFVFTYLPDVAARPLATPGAHGVADRLRIEVNQEIDGGVAWISAGQENQPTTRMSNGSMACEMDA